MSTRTTDVVICDNDIKKAIIRWCNSEGWLFEDFATFVELTGVETPISLSEWNQENCSFKCTAQNAEVTISIYLGEWDTDSRAELWLTYVDETRKYEITKRYEINRSYKNWKGTPHVDLIGRIIRKGKKELRCFYNKDFVQRTVKLSDSDSIEVTISEPSMKEKKSEIVVLTNCTRIEEYLIGLEKNCNIVQVYEKLMEMLRFSKEEFVNCKEIFLNYVEIVNEKKVTRNRIFLENGNLQEYVEYSDGETYCLRKDGWAYCSNDVQIEYCATNKQYTFSVTGFHNRITNISPWGILSRVEAIVYEMKNFAKKNVVK